MAWLIGAVLLIWELCFFFFLCHSGGLSVGTLVGIIVGVLVGIAVIGGIISVIVRKMGRYS